MHFLYPRLLFLELLIPALMALALWGWYRRRRLLAVFGEPHLTARLSSASAAGQLASALLRIAALALIIMAAARPQFGMKLVETSQRGADIVIAVDVSASMTAEDLKPNRLARAKDTLSALIHQLGGSRVGIVAFAGTAFWQCPLTFDLAGANLFLQIMDANLIPLPGTAIGAAIRTGVKGLEKTAPKTKAIVLLTDGEDHKSDPAGAAAEAARNGVKIFTVGFGNPAGEPIPLHDGQGNFAGYKKDKNGKTVMSKMDEALLAKIAAETGGEYFRATDGAFDTSRLAGNLQNLEKAKGSSRTNRQYEDRYQWFLGLALLLLLADFFVPAGKRQDK